MAKPPQMPPASPLSLHATTVEVEVMVMVMVLVMVMVAVTVSPVPVVVAVTVAVSVTAEVVSSLLPQPCKDREAMKPKQMAANARASCMITKIDDVKRCQKQMSGSLFTSAGIATACIVKSSQTKLKAIGCYPTGGKCLLLPCLFVVSDVSLGCALLGGESFIIRT